MIGKILGTMFWFFLIVVLWFCWFDLRDDLKKAEGKRFLFLALTLLISILITAGIVLVLKDIYNS